MAVFPLVCSSEIPLVSLMFVNMVVCVWGGGQLGIPKSVIAVTLRGGYACDLDKSEAR